jgi:hypothetical protein
LEYNGICIIKIHEIFYKPIVDILYILCSSFEKVYIIKPNTSNVTSFEKYIVCKGFIKNQKLHMENYKIIKNLLDENNDSSKENIDTKYITSLLEYDIPYYFMNKIDDINIILGHQQLESLDQIIQILKNKNKNDKIESIKKTHMHKCINWCDKFKIPYNKFSDKINIFLPIREECPYYDLENILYDNINPLMDL